MQRRKNREAARRFTSANEPDRHAGLEGRRIALRIEAQAQRIAVVITDRALSLPGCKWPQQQELSDERRGRFARACPSHVDRVPMLRPCRKSSRTLKDSHCFP